MSEFIQNTNALHEHIWQTIEAARAQGEVLAAIQTVSPTDAFYGPPMYPALAVTEETVFSEHATVTEADATLVMTFQILEKDGDPIRGYRTCRDLVSELATLLESASYPDITSAPEITAADYQAPPINNEAIAAEVQLTWVYVYDH